MAEFTNVNDLTVAELESAMRLLLLKQRARQVSGLSERSVIHRAAADLDDEVTPRSDVAFR